MIELQANTKIKDALGVEHDYMTIKFGSEVGTGIFLRLAKVVAGPLSEFLLSVDLGATESVLDVDVSGLGRAIADFPSRLLAEGGFSFLSEILRQTKRGRTDPSTGRVDWADLKDRHNVDRVYAGNYPELFRAVSWVVLVNFAPFLPDGSQSWLGLWKMLKDALPGPDTVLGQLETERTGNQGSEG